MRARPIVAIDGPAGAGKSTVARRLAEALGFTLVEATSDELTVSLFGEPAAPGAVPARMGDRAPAPPLFVMRKTRGGDWTRVSGPAGG